MKALYALIYVMNYKNFNCNCWINEIKMKHE